MFPALEEIQLRDEMEILINATTGNHNCQYTISNTNVLDQYIINIYPKKGCISHITQFLKMGAFHCT